DGERRECAPLDELRARGAIVTLSRSRWEPSGADGCAARVGPAVIAAVGKTGGRRSLLRARDCWQKARVDGQKSTKGRLSISDPAESGGKSPSFRFMIYY